DIAQSAQLPVFWGVQGLQGLHIGFFVAIAALVVFWAILNRTTVGYEMRAVGYNPEAAAYGGISVKKNLIRAMAISGAFAGLAGGLDMLGYLYHYGVSDIPVSSVGFLGIAVALLGRNTAAGTGLAALLFGALLFGTTHGLASNVIAPDLAGNLTYMIQGLVVLFVGVAAAMLGLWTATRGLRRLGWGAVVAGLLGLGLGILATRSSTGNLNIVFTASLIASMFVFSTPLVFGAIGGMFSERSGVV